MKYILFDFDGTIVDTEAGITDAAARALRSFGIETADLAELRPFIGPPLLDSFMEISGLSREQAEQAVQIFREYYSAHGLAQSTPYKGIGAMLKRLRDRGLILAIATSKPAPAATKILEDTGLIRHFDFISGTSYDGDHSTKADVIRTVLAHYQIADHSEAVMVGDRKFDVEGAHEVGLRCIGVLYGFGHREELSDAGAQYIAEDLAELERLLLELSTIKNGAAL